MAFYKKDRKWRLPHQAPTSRLQGLRIWNAAHEIVMRKNPNTLKRHETRRLDTEWSYFIPLQLHHKHGLRRNDKTILSARALPILRNNGLYAMERSTCPIPPALRSNAAGHLHIMLAASGKPFAY